MTLAPLRPTLLRSTLLAAVVVLPGCITTVGPDYEAPQLDAGTAYQAPLPQTETALDGTDWWRSFDDPTLVRLIDEGLKSNLDMALADSQVRQLAATLVSTHGGRLPSVDLSNSATATSDRAVAARPKNADNKMSPTANNVFAVAFSWAADLFGGLKRSEEAALADLERQTWDRSNTGLTVAADIARAYVILRGAQQRRVLTEESLNLQRRTVDIVTSRVNAGLAPGLDLARAEAAVQSLEADLRPIESEIRQARDALAILLGRLPGDFEQVLPTDDAGNVPAISAAPVIGSPADLLRRRPDLRAAERDLARATAEIGVAESALYPSLTIPAKFQITSGTWGGTEILHTLLASLGATLDLPLYSGGSLEADVTVAEEQARQALITYRATMLTALSEVETALNAYAGAERRLAALMRSEEADQRAYEQADDLYTQGLTSFLDILDAQRTLTATRLKLVTTRTTAATAAMDLFQAVGMAPELPDPSNIETPSQ